MNSPLLETLENVLTKPSEILCECGHKASEHGAMCFVCGKCDRNIDVVLKRGYRAALVSVREELEALTLAVRLLGRPFGDDPCYWWQPFNDEQLSSEQADALNLAIARVYAAAPPVGWTEFAAEEAKRKAGA